MLFLMGPFPIAEWEPDHIPRILRDIRCTEPPRYNDAKAPGNGGGSRVILLGDKVRSYLQYLHGEIFSSSPREVVRASRLDPKPWAAPGLITGEYWGRPGTAAANRRGLFTRILRYPMVLLACIRTPPTITPRRHSDKTNHPPHAPLRIFCSLQCPSRRRRSG